MKKLGLIILLLGLYSGTIRAQLLDSLQLDSIPAITDLQEALRQPEKVIKLELRKKKYKKFPIEIFQFPNLQYLDISRNSIKEIPDSMYMIPHLQYFDASKNKISSMPKSIGRLKRLAYLNFNNNELFGLPPQIGMLENLRILDLWSNELSDFPESMKMLKNLLVLDLRAILMDEALQKRLKELMPNTTIHMSPSCNCKLN